MVSCGIDVEPLERISDLYHRGAMPLGLFSEKELKYMNSYISVAHAFVAKEAILKSLGAGWFNTNIDAHDIELGFGKGGVPGYVTFYGEAKLRVDKGGFNDYTLDFFYLGNDLLALFILSTLRNKSMKKSVVAVDRAYGKTQYLCSRKIVKAQWPEEKHMSSAKILGKLAVNMAVCEVKNECLPSLESGQVRYDDFGVPVWVDTTSKCLSTTRIDAISITHDHNYACGVAVSA